MTVTALPPRLPARRPRPPVPPGPYLIVGLGKAGAAATRVLAEHAGGSAILGWDVQVSPGPQANADRLATIGGRSHLGTWEGSGLAEAHWRCLVKSPGIHPGAAPFREAARRGAAVLDEAELGWRLGRWPLVGITGTNGKSTVCSLVQAILRGEGMDTEAGGNTQDGPPLSDLAAHAPSCVVGELSSYQLEASPALLPEVAILTNITRDHLHRHRTMANYAASKRRLFIRDGDCAGVSVLNADDPRGRAFARDIEAAGGRVVRYGRSASAQVRVEDTEWDARSGMVGLRVEDRRIELRTRLPGLHNAQNAAAAMATAWSLGLSLDRAAEALAEATAPPGRFELVEAGQPFLAVVDFGHNPDGVRQALLTATTLTGAGGRVRAVLGGVGKLDPGKRPSMGRIAAELSDHLVISLGSSFGEAPEPVLESLVRGARRSRKSCQVEVIADRRRAFERIVDAARPGDVVIILSRGPLQVLRLNFAGDGPRFDDREVLREVLTR